MELNFQEFNYLSQLKKRQQLFADCFPEVFKQDYTNIQYNTDKYEWQFHSFPAGKTSYEYVAMLDQEIVGYYASLPYKYKIGDKIALSGMVCGVMTNPKFRKSGIFTKLGNFATEQQKANGVDFNLTFPIRKAVMPGFMRMGWDVVFEMPLYIKFLKLDSLLRSKKLFVLAPIVNPFLGFYNFFLKKSENKNIVVKIYTSIKEIQGYNEFIEKYNKTIANTLIKDMAFSNWRYSSPDAQYLFFCAYKEDQLMGFISARPINREGIPSYGILDFMCNSNDCLNNLHSSLTAHAKQNNMEAVIMIMSKISSKKYKLISNGFLKSPFRFHFIIKNLSNKFANELFYNEDLWHLMFVDSDDL